MMGNQNNQNPGAPDRLAKENAQKDMEFGNMEDKPEKDTNIVHEEKPPSNHTGIDRKRWSD